MALNLRRWLLVAIVGFAMVAVAWLPPKPPEQLEHRVIQLQFRDRYQVDSRLREARTELALLELRSWLDERLTSRPLPAGKASVLSDGPSSAAQVAITALLARVWPLLGNVNDSVAIGVLVPGDTVLRYWGDRYVLPSNENGNSCITVVNSGRYSNPGIRDATLNTFLAEDLGLCLLYAAFGRPGPRIESWLKEGGISFSTWFDFENRLVDSVAMSGINNPSFRESPFRFWEIYSGTPAGLACRAGKLVVCTSIVLEPAAGLRTREGPFVEPTYQWRRPFGGATAAYLSDLSRTIGKERFSRFWKSSLSVENAFEDAFGMSVGQRTYEWFQEGRTAHFSPGPLPGRRSSLYAGGITLLFFGLALMVAARSRLGK